MQAAVGTASRRWWEFGDRSNKPSSGRNPADEAPPASRADELDGAVDLVARMLRLMGEVPVLPDQPELARLRNTCEAWARHILTRAPPPDGVPSPQRGGRAWVAAGTFMTERRHAEQEQIAADLGDLRSAVVVIADAVRGSLGQEQSDTQAVLEAVGSLQLVASDGTFEELRNEVRRAADELLGLATQRDARQQELSDRVSQLSDQVAVLVVEVRQAQQVGTTDSLTGLLNRFGFESAARRGLGMSMATGRSLSLALIDLDDLKWVNDHHGHAAGDAAIRALADSLRATCRTTDYLARVGGDEFAAILVDADAFSAERIVGRFLQELWSRNLLVASGAETIHVSASVGIALAGPGETLPSWTARADRWMYRAKSLGKNRVLGDGLPSPADSQAQPQSEGQPDAAA